MSMMLITTAAVMSPAASIGSSSGDSMSCPLSDFGGYCLFTFGVMMVLAVSFMIAGATANYTSKRFEWCMGTSIALLAGSFIPVVVGMIHDCQ